MTRRPAGGPLTPRRGNGGGFGAMLQRGGIAPLVALGGAGLLLLVVIIIIFRSCAASPAAADADCSKKPPTPPAGFSYASKYCVTASKLAGQRSDTFTIPLTDKSGARGLSMYAYD